MELLTALLNSGELQRRLDLDPVLNNAVVVRLLTWLPPSALFRTEEKSAGHTLAAAFSSEAPFSQRPKALHLDSLQLKEPSAESKDPRKRMTLWKDSVRYAHVLSDFEFSFVEESKVVKKSYMWRDAMKGQRCRPGEQS